MEPIQKYMSQNEHKMQLIIKQRKIICIKRNYPINNRRFFVHWKIGCDSLNACCFISFHFIVICFIIWCVCARALIFSSILFYFIMRFALTLLSNSMILNTTHYYLRNALTLISLNLCSSFTFYLFIYLVFFASFLLIPTYPMAESILSENEFPSMWKSFQWLCILN